MMARKSDKIEPKVRISRICHVCGKVFALSHPNDPRLMCEECQSTLGEMIRRYKSEQQEVGDEV